MTGAGGRGVRVTLMAGILPPAAGRLDPADRRPGYGLAGHRARRATAHDHDALSGDRTSLLKARRPTEELAFMNTDDANDMSMRLIANKAGSGLAPPKWRLTLEQIRGLPEVQTRKGLAG